MKLINIFLRFSFTLAIVTVSLSNNSLAQERALPRYLKVNLSQVYGIPDAAISVHAFTDSGIIFGSALYPELRRYRTFLIDTSTGKFSFIFENERGNYYVAYNDGLYVAQNHPTVLRPIDGASSNKILPLEPLPGDLGAYVYDFVEASLIPPAILRNAPFAHSLAIGESRQFMSARPAIFVDGRAIVPRDFNGGQTMSVFPRLVNRVGGIAGTADTSEEGFVTWAWWSNYREKATAIRLPRQLAWSTLYDLNNKNEMVGSGSEHTPYHRNYAIYASPEGAKLLPRIADSDWETANYINNDGLVLGRVNIPDRQTREAALWTRTGKGALLSSLEFSNEEGCPLTEISGLSNSGAIVGILHCIIETGLALYVPLTS